MTYYYVVTGAAGLIGSNIISALNKRGIENIIAVDDLTEGNKFLNIVDSNIAYYYDKAEFIQYVCKHRLSDFKILAIFHEGACSDTMNHDGRFMMSNNYQYTVDLFHWAQDKKIPFLYASSAAVYGKGTIFRESREYESPLNVYGYSKFLFDQYLRGYLKNKKLKSQVVGFRYFNVYGLHEQHKGRMASVAFHHFNQFNKKGYVELFGGYDGYENGEQKRDFISVEDVVKVNLYFLNNPNKSGIYNLGTGNSESFNELAKVTVNTIRQSQNKEKLSLDEMVEQGLIRYIDFPNNLKGKYQSFTQADISQLRQSGYHDDFLSLEEGVSRYMNQLLKQNN
ncbi:MAG: ADP-glyceromanno-heptose 6-epimerase [Neisseriaceae bacterium]|nr:MAG: ADP-glyceromanno-heptose 6-epimerase [Neisseriaceae bacterium]